MKFIIFLLLFCAIYAKPKNLSERDASTCGYNGCRPVDHNKINVHLVPHSHDDVGWLLTVDQYYYTQVQHIISSVVDALWENPDRKFIQVETAYFYMWWNQQDEETQDQVRELVNEGRLEIVNGAWTMNDEAAVNYQSTIDQYTIGLKFIDDILGKCGRPKVSWQIDPFGHSREQASLLAQMGMDGVLLGRLDYRDKQQRKSDKSMDMIWTGSANLGYESNIFSSALYGEYASPQNFCFDISCSDDPIVKDLESTEYNLETKVEEFTKFIKEQAQHYPTNHILITLGEDFQWQAARDSFINVDNLKEGFKLFNPKIDDKEINVIYSSPTCYVKAVRDFVEMNNIKLNVKTDDFFPYADTENTVWSGYYTSRPTSKKLDRLGNNLLQVTKQLTAIGGTPYSTINPLSQAMATMQHHDAITGTEKSAVEKDYHRDLVKGMNEAISDISSTFSAILGLDNNLNLRSCLLSNVSICSESDRDEFNVLIYNPLSRTVSNYVQIPINDGDWKVTGPSGEEVYNHVYPSIRNFDYITENTGERVLDGLLYFRASDLPPLGYKVYKIQRNTDEAQISKRDDINTRDLFGFADHYVTFDSQTHVISSITLNDVTLRVSQSMLFYDSDDTSGAYIFRPDAELRDALEFGKVKISAQISSGGEVIEVFQEWAEWAKQTVRIYEKEDFVEFDWVVGPIETDQYGKEVIIRYTTEITDTDGVFYTDSNGRELISRKTNYRPTYSYTDEEPQAGNYYPVNTRMLIKNESYEFAVITDRSEGGASLKSGEIELMLSRALTADDHRGVGEILNEMEYDQKLIVRGSHYVTLGKSDVGNGKQTMAALERDIVQRKLLQPWIFYTSENIPVDTDSFLNKELPANVHILTLENWNDSNNEILIRLEHVFEKDEDPDLSKEVTVDVSDLFKTISIKSMKEYMLAANIPLEESTRLNWSQVDKTESESSPLNKNARLRRKDTDLNITLAPMQIRTFIATVERSS